MQPATATPAPGSDWLFILAAEGVLRRQKHRTQVCALYLGLLLDEGRGPLSVQAIAAESGLDARSVQRAARDLEREGVLRRHATVGGASVWTLLHTSHPPLQSRVRLGD